MFLFLILFHLYLYFYMHNVLHHLCILLLLHWHVRLTYHYILFLYILTFEYLLVLRLQNQMLFHLLFLPLCIICIIHSTSPLTLDSSAPIFAFSITFPIRGIAINAIIASITITASNSTNVNPFFFIKFSPILL